MNELSNKERIEKLENDYIQLKIELTNRMEIINHNFESVQNVLRPKKLKIPGFEND